MTSQEIEAIAGGYHGDPFHVLGPHSVSRKKWEVRAFLPQAEAAAVVLDGAPPAAMEKLHSDGFFCVSLAGVPAGYSIRARLWDGREIEIDDPYRYGPQISDADLYLHTEGTLFEAYRTLGAHVTEGGVRFAVWAPNALNVTVAGEFNEWDIRRHPMRWRNGGVWELFIPGLGEGAIYKYYVRSKIGGYQQLKADPYAFLCEAPPKSASVVWKCEKYQWDDAAWMDARVKRRGHEPVVDEEVFLDPELHVAPLQISRPIPADAMTQRQVLGPGRGADRIGLHEPEPANRFLQRRRREERVRNREPPELVQGHGFSRAASHVSTSLASSAGSIISTMCPALG